MTKYTLILLLFISILNFSCNNSSKNIPKIDDDTLNLFKYSNNHEDTAEIKTSNTDTIPDFKTMAENFISSFNKKDSITLNNYIHPDYGIAVLDNPGAYHSITTYTTFSESGIHDGIFNSQYLLNMNIYCKLEFGKIPYFSCDDNGWDKEGCFYTDNAKLNLVKIHDALVEYFLMEENSEYRSSLIYIENITKHGIYSTDSFIGFYFGYINNKWYLFCVDKVSPCSA